MKAKISDQIANLRTLSRQQLLDMWQKLYRNAAPNGIRRELIVPFLAYRIQENAYGGLRPAVRKELGRLARCLEGPAAATAPLLRPKIKVGTRMIRQWRGETHEVVVTQSGYEYRGASYGSLSEIARKITSMRWSGPAFFGLNKASAIRGRRNDH